MTQSSEATAGRGGGTATRGHKHSIAGVVRCLDCGTTFTPPRRYRGYYCSACHDRWNETLSDDSTPTRVSSVRRPSVREEAPATAVRAAPSWGVSAKRLPYGEYT